MLFLAPTAVPSCPPATSVAATRGEKRVYFDIRSIRELCAYNMCSRLRRSPCMPHGPAGCTG